MLLSFHVLLHAESPWQQVLHVFEHKKPILEAILWFDILSMSFPEISVLNNWDEWLQYWRMKVYPPYAFKASQNHARSPSWIAGLEWPHYVEKVAVPQKWGLHTTSILSAHNHKEYNHLPEVGLQSPLLQATSLLMCSCRTFRSFLVWMSQFFNTCQPCYIVTLNQPMTYLQFSSCTTFPPWAYKIHIKCVNIAFHTLSSNSWSRSTTNKRKKLKRPSSVERCSENAF